MNKTLFFHPRNDFSGSTRVLANIIEAEYADQEVEIITMSCSDGFLSHLPNVHIVPIHQFSIKKYKIPIITQLAWRINAILLAWKYGKNCDTFYINTLLPWYAAIVGKWCHKRIIYHVHEKFVVSSPEIKFAEYVFKHVNAKRIFVSRYVQSCYPSRHDCEETVKYNTLPASFFNAVQMIPLGKRKRNTILMISSLSKAKGVFTFLEVAKLMPHLSFKLVLSASPNAITHFIGNDIPTNMKWWPAQRDIHPFLQTSDVILNLSIPALWVETFGMTILEAMAYGLPAIVPNVGGPIEIVKNGYNGYCIDVTDVGLVTQTIDRVLEKDEYERLTTNTLKRVKILN